MKLLRPQAAQTMIKVAIASNNLLCFVMWANNKGALLAAQLEWIRGVKGECPIIITLAAH